MSIWYDPTLQRFRDSDGRFRSRASGLKSSTGRESYRKAQRKRKTRKTRKPKQRTQRTQRKRPQRKRPQRKRLHIPQAPPAGTGDFTGFVEIPIHEVGSGDNAPLDIDLDDMEVMDWRDFEEEYESVWEEGDYYAKKK